MRRRLPCPPPLQHILSAQGTDQLRVQQRFGRLLACGRRHVKLLVQRVQEPEIAQRGLARAGVKESFNGGVIRACETSSTCSRTWAGRGAGWKWSCGITVIEHLALEGEHGKAVVLPPPAAQWRHGIAGGIRLGRNADVEHAQQPQFASGADVADQQIAESARGQQAGSIGKQAGHRHQPPPLQCGGVCGRRRGVLARAFGDGAAALGTGGGGTPGGNEPLPPGLTVPPADGRPMLRKPAKTRWLVNTSSTAAMSPGIGGQLLGIGRTEPLPQRFEMLTARAGSSARRRPPARGHCLAVCVSRRR